MVVDLIKKLACSNIHVTMSQRSTHFFLGTNTRWRWHCFFSQLRTYSFTHSSTSVRPPTYLHVCLDSFVLLDGRLDCREVVTKVIHADQPLVVFQPNLTQFGLTGKTHSRESDNNDQRPSNGVLFTFCHLISFKLKTICFSLPRLVQGTFLVPIFFIKAYFSKEASSQLFQFLLSDEFLTQRFLAGVLSFLQLDPCLWQNEKERRHQTDEKKNSSYDIIYQFVSPVSCWAMLWFQTLPQHLVLKESLKSIPFCV